MWRSGISIGHKDTDNILSGNRIHGNANYGICVRIKTPANGAHRNVFGDNLIENNGLDPRGMPEFVRRFPAAELVGCGIHIYGVTDGIVLEGNTFRETRPEGRQWQRHAVVVEPGVTNLDCRDNKIEPHPESAILDHRTAVETPETPACHA